MHCLTGFRRSLRHRILTRLALALFGVFVVLASACGDDSGEDFAEVVSDDSATSAPAAYAADSESEGTAAGGATEEEAAMAEEPSEGSDAALAVPTALTPADLGRDIVYRATIAVEADDVTAASREAVAIVQGLGGIVFGQTTRTEPQPRAEITFKVLPADFSTALERLAGVGRLVDQSISADDVTERIVDLGSRITTAEASVDRLRKLLAEAAELKDVATIERELLDRETTLETLRGQLRTLRDQVDLATITLTITQSPTVLPDTGIRATTWVSDDADGDPCLGTQHLTVAPDSTVYLCLEVENTGASALTDVKVRSRDLRLDSFQIPADGTDGGSFDRIEPNQLLVALLSQPVEDGRLAGRVATRGLEIVLEVEAVPVDAEGTALQKVTAFSSVWVEARASDSLPGFRDSVASGAGFLGSIASVALVVVGLIVPFLPLVAVIVALIWWRRHRKQLRNRPVAATDTAGAEEAAGRPAAHEHTDAEAGPEPSERDETVDN